MDEFSRSGERCDRPLQEKILLRVADDPSFVSAGGEKKSHEAIEEQDAQLGSGPQTMSIEEALDNGVQ